MIRWYSLIVLAAILIGIWIAGREAERKGLDKETIYDLATWLIPAGIVGARLFHVIDHWDHGYSLAPVRVFYVWQGGLAIWGGVIGGLVALVILTCQRGWRLPLLLDTLAPAVVLGQGIGRLAGVITGDAVGKPTTGPFGLAYTNPNAMVPELGVYYIPMPIYETIMNVSIFALLYVVLYAGGRFLITFWSAYRTIAFGLNQAQIISIVALAVGLPLLIYILQRRNPTQALA